MVRNTMLGGSGGNLQSRMRVAHDWRLKARTKQTAAKAAREKEEKDRIAVEARERARALRRYDTVVITIQHGGIDCITSHRIA